MPAKKRTTRKTQRMTEADRRKYVEARGWKTLPRMTNTYSPIGIGSGAVVNVRTGKVTDDSMMDFCSATDAQFRAFVNRHTPKKAPVPRLTLASLAADVDARLKALENRSFIIGGVSVTPPLNLAAGETLTIRQNEPEPDPDATREERRAELEARGLKHAPSSSDSYCRNGVMTDPRRGCLDGAVYDTRGAATKTRTLAEFRAALDAVGLVKQTDPLDAPLTREAFDAECKVRGGVLDDAPYLHRFKFTPTRVAVFHGDAREERAFVQGQAAPTLRELRAVLDRESPKLCGDGPSELEVAKARIVELEAKLDSARKALT